MSSYRDLVVWNKAMDHAEEIYRITRQFPKEETYGLTSQVRRAGVSIPSNIAEGQRRGKREFRHFLHIANGSLAEAETQIELAKRFRYVGSDDVARLFVQSTEIGKMLNGLIRSLNSTNHEQGTTNWSNWS